MGDAYLAVDLHEADHMNLNLVAIIAVAALVVAVIALVT